MTMKTNFHFPRAAFSLVEVLAAIAIIGIVTFLAIPNIVRVKQDAEDNLARARAESLNMAVASYIQAVGTNIAQTNWSGAGNAAARYALVRPYLAFSETNFSSAGSPSFVPAGYSFTLATSIVPMTAKPVTSISNTSRSVAVPY